MELYYYCTYTNCRGFAIGKVFYRDWYRPEIVTLSDDDIDPEIRNYFEHGEYQNMHGRLANGKFFFLVKHLKYTDAYEKPADRVVMNMSIAFVTSDEDEYKAWVRVDGDRESANTLTRLCRNSIIIDRTDSKFGITIDLGELRNLAHQSFASILNMDNVVGMDSNNKHHSIKAVVAAISGLTAIGGLATIIKKIA